jgi:hypothetical protein
MSLILRASLLVNAVLILVVGMRLSCTPRGPKPAPTQGVRAISQFPHAVLPAGKVELEARKSWDWIESGDPAQLIANLRKVGCPEQTIQDLVCLRLCRAMRQQLLEQITQQQRSTPYWKATPQEQFRAQMDLRQKLNDEVDAKLEPFFGQGGRALRVRAAGLSPAFVEQEYLPPDKANQVRDVERRFRERASELSASNLPIGYADPDPDADAIRKDLNRQKLADLQQILSLREYELYLLHSSPAANYVRANLPEAKSEDAFRRMVKVALEFEMDDQSARSLAARHGLVSEDDESTRAQKENERAFQLRLAQELGDDRVAAQQDAEAAQQRQDREQMSRRSSVASITEIGATEAEATRFLDRIMALQPKFETRAKELIPEADEAVRKGNATPEQRQAFETFVKAEMEQAATEIMGPEKAKALIEQMERRSKR